MHNQSRVGEEGPPNKSRNYCGHHRFEDEMTEKRFTHGHKHVFPLSDRGTAWSSSCPSCPTDSVARQGHRRKKLRDVGQAESKPFACDVVQTLGNMILGWVDVSLVFKQIKQCSEVSDINTREKERVLAFVGVIDITCPLEGVAQVHSWLRQMCGILLASASRSTLASLKFATKAGIGLLAVNI